MKYSRIKFVLAAFIAVCAVPSSAGGSGLEGALLGYGISFDNSRACVLEKKYLRGGRKKNDKRFATVTASCPGPAFRFEIVSGISEKAALKLVESRFTRVKMLYGGFMEYPGAITSRTEVPAELRPRVVPAGPLGYETIYLPASANRAYGAGAQDLVKYAAAMSYRYCPGPGTFVQIEVFAAPGTKDKELDYWLEAVSCGSASGVVKK